MSTKSIIVFLVLGGVLIGVVGILVGNLRASVPTVAPEVVAITGEWTGVVTERYIGQVDRVAVVFEHKDYTHFRLQTNDRVRTGALNTERGYKDDGDATVYVLDWQKPEGEQMRYVRLTAEPAVLYLLSSDDELIFGSKLSLVPQI